MTVALPFIPERDGYSVTVSYPTIVVALEGGPSRRRLDYLFAPHIVELTWLLNSPTKYSQFMGFFRTTVRYGTEAFLVDLITDVGTELPHKCRCTGGLPRLVKQSGHGYWATATLEVEPNPAFTGSMFFNTTILPYDLLLIDGDFTRDFAISPGDTVRIMDSSGIHETGDIPINLDGDYEVSTMGTLNTLSFVSPASVNSDWTVLSGIVGGIYTDATQVTPVTPTIVRIPT